MKRPWDSLAFLKNNDVEYTFTHRIKSADNDFNDFKHEIRGLIAL